MKSCVVTLLALTVLCGCMSVPDLDGHNATFLGANASVRYMNILSPVLSYNGFKDHVGQMKHMGANYVYVYTANQGDGSYVPFSLYHGHQIGGDLNGGVVDEVLKRLKYLQKEGFGVVIWLRSDDTRWWDQYGVAQQEKYQSDVVKLYDDYAQAYVIGLEADEYFSAGEVNHYAAHMQSITKKPILTHQRPGRWDHATSAYVDGAGIQYGFGKSGGEVQHITATAKAQLGGKPVYGVEYHKSSESNEARVLGDHVMAGGGSGTGNNRNNPPKRGNGWIGWFNDIKFW